MIVINIGCSGQDAAREAKKGKGKRYPTPSSEPEEGEEDPLALKSLELASMETPMAHQVTLDSGAATSCTPVELAAALGYKPISSLKAPVRSTRPPRARS